MTRQPLCPYCLKTLPLDAVTFRCINPDVTRCAWEDDEPLARYERRPVDRRQRVFAIPVSPGQTVADPRCSCGASASQVVCAACHNRIPDWLAETESLIIVVIGAKASGKSHYNAILLQELTERIFGSGNAFHAQLSPDEETRKRYDKDFKSYREAGLVFEPTRSARQSSAVRVPLIYSLKFAQNPSNPAAPTSAVSLVFFDVPGEDLNSTELINTEHPYIAKSDGLILLLDPLQIPAVRDQLAGKIPLPPLNTDPQAILVCVAALMRRTQGLLAMAKINTPIALAFSKIDAVLDMFEGESRIRQDSNHKGRFDVEDAAYVNASMRSKIADWVGGNFDSYLQINFTRSSYFGVSALGRSPTVDGKIVGGVHPLRVADPVLWLLYQHGVILGTDEGARVRRRRLDALMRALGAVARMTAKLAILAGVLVAAYTLYAYRYNPPGLWFAHLKLKACRDPSSGPSSHRCGCVKILAEAADTLSLDERLRLLTPYGAACWAERAQTTTDPALGGVLLRMQLAQSVVEPASFCQANIKLLKRDAQVDLGPAANWYPSATPGETALMKWVFLGSTGEPQPELAIVRDSFQPDELAKRPQLKRLLDKAIGVAPCLGAWHQALHRGDWKPVEKECAQKLSLLPAELMRRLKADLPPGLLRTRLLAIAVPTTPREVNAQCPPELGLDALLFPAPKEDALTLANRAVSAKTAEDFAKDLAASVGAEPAHRILIELLSRWKTPDERLQFAGRLTDLQIAAMTDFLMRPWVRIDDGRTIGDKRRSRPDGRVPNLLLKSAREAACALLGVKDSAGNAAIPWPEPITVDDIDPGNPQLSRVRLARKLLDEDPERKDMDFYVCSITALLQSVRSTDTAHRAADLRELESAVEKLEKDPARGLGAHDLHCQILAEYDLPAGALSQVTWLLGNQLRDSSSEHRAGLCAARAILWEIGRAHSDRASLLLEHVRSVLPNEDAVPLVAALNIAQVDGGSQPSENTEQVIQGLSQRFTGDYLRTALAAAARGLRATAAPQSERGD